MTNRIKATALLLFSFSLFCSCEKGNGSDTTSSIEDSSSFSEGKSDSIKSEELTESMLYEASYGVAVESQIVHSSTTDAGDDVDNIVTYNSCILDYETTANEYSYRLYSDIYDENHYKDTDPIPYENLNPNRKSLSMMRDYTVSKDGMLLDKRLTKDNTIVTYFGRKDGSVNETVGISYTTSGFYNFFSAFSSSDFKKGEEKYSFILDTENVLDASALSEAAVCMTAGLNTTALKSLTLYTDGYHITSYEAELEPVVADDWIPGVVYTFKTFMKGNIIAIGKDDSTVTKHFLNVIDKSEDEKLKSAIDSLKLGNYTEKVTFNRKGEDETKQSEVEYQRVGNTMCLLSSDGVKSGYYVTEASKRQNLRYLNGGYYKDGSEVVNDIPFASFDMSLSLFDKTDDGKYHFSMVDTGVLDCTSSLFADGLSSSALNDVVIEVKDNSVVVSLKGKDSMNASFEATVTYSDIGTTDNGIDIEHLESMDDLTWKDILSPDDYLYVTENINEDILNQIPLLNNGYFSVTPSLYNAKLRFDYSLGNVYSLFDEDQNGILSKKETENYYVFRDNLYSLYQVSLAKKGFENISFSKENDHIISMETENEDVSLTITILEKDATSRDLAFRIAVSI